MCSERLGKYRNDQRYNNQMRPPTGRAGNSAWRKAASTMPLRGGWEEKWWKPVARWLHRGGCSAQTYNRWLVFSDYRRCTSTATPNKNQIILGDQVTECLSTSNICSMSGKSYGWQTQTCLPWPNKGAALLRKGTIPWENRCRLKKWRWAIREEGSSSNSNCNWSTAPHKLLD